MGKLRTLYAILILLYLSFTLILKNNLFDFLVKNKIREETKNVSWVQKYGIPVLCYHHVISDMNEAKSLFHLQKSKFKEQIKWLKENGFSTISLEDFSKYLNNEPVLLPEKPVLITFDDGRKNFFRNARDILNEVDYKAVLFVYPGPIEKGHSYFLSWSELELLKNEGHEIQSHAYSHPNLSKLSAAEQNAEIMTSKEIIEKKLNIKVNWLAYPFGVYNHTTVNELKKENFKGAFTVFTSGNFAGEEKYSLKRTLILRDMSINDLAHKIMTVRLPLDNPTPSAGSVVVNEQTIRLNLPKQLIKENMRVEMGSDFVNSNQQISFSYNENTGLMQVDIKRITKRYLVITVSYNDGIGTYMQNSIMYNYGGWIPLS
ncbi:MAG: polysaccharide deacetylase family protein [Spirochaetia bacterium]|nr:polysaccharide deacetylase family protein [Spirochaetia bacterium]